MPPKRKKVAKAKGVSKKKIPIKNEPADTDGNGQTEEPNKTFAGIKCKNCGLFSKTYFLHHKHLALCLEEKGLNAEDSPKAIDTISCKECNKKFRFVKSYLEHVNNEHSKKPGSVPCLQCSVRCPNKAALKIHISNVHEREMFECPHCKKQFVRHAHVLRHLEQTGCDGQGVTLFPCEICNAKFSRKDNLMVHLRLQHIIHKKFKCKMCPYSTATFSKLFIHHQKKHSETPHHYECHHCGKVTSSRAAISKHLEIHGEKKYSCEVCGYSTYTIEVMRRHVLTHVQDKPYKCTECKASFIQRVQLLKHFEKHRGLTCNLCKKSFNSKPNYRSHLKKHETAENETKSEGVDEEVNDKLKGCEDDRPYKCEICSKMFSSEHIMRRHVTSHTLERPRRCMYCVTARAYVRGAQLVRHVRKAHPTVFNEHLCHVRRVLGQTTTVRRVRTSEMESILNVLDAEADRILQGYGEGVLYGGMQETYEIDVTDQELGFKTEESPLMSEEELAENLKKLLSQLIDKETLECFGWPEESVDTVLEKVIEQCGARPADRDKWTRVQCLRENAKHLFLYVIEDKNIARMLDTHTIDQIVKHILAQVTDNPDEKCMKSRKCTQLLGNVYNSEPT